MEVTTGENNPLSKLLFDPSETSREIISDALEEFIGISKSSGEIVPKPQYFKQSKKARLLIYLLSRKALKFLGLVNSESTNPEDISKTSGVGLKTVRESMSRLRKDRLVENDGEGWYIPDKALLLVSDYLQKNGDTE